MLSLTPFRRVIKDYFLICESYFKAIRNAPPSQIEALDMGRRGLHDEGSELLQERLEGQDRGRFRHGAAAVHAHLRAASEGLSDARGQMARSCPARFCSPARMNAVRSPMAAAIMRHLFGKFVYVDSAGVRAGELDPLAVEVMDEIGIEIGKHKPKSFEDLEDSSFDLVITLSPEAQHRRWN